MSFIDKFLDLTAPLPREIVRFLKLYKIVEERCKQININLKINREKYLQKLKEKEINNNDIINLKNTIDLNYKEILTLSDYKQEILKELQYIFEYSFLDKLSPILEEGKKECQDQLTQNDFNNIYNTNVNHNHLNKMINDDIKNASDVNNKNKKNDLYTLGRKTKRKKSKKQIDGSAISDEGGQNLQEKEISKSEVYCKCNGPSYGKMIECDKCKNWFHYVCVGIIEGEEPKEWLCDTCKEGQTTLKKSEKIKKKKKIYN